MSAQLNYAATPKLMQDGGIGWFLVVVCYTAMVGFIAANTYHTDNFLSTMLAVVEGTVFSFVVSYISFALCLSEIPLSKSIVTDYRFNDDKINFKIVMKSVLGVAIACLAMAGTLNSQKMNASLIDSEVSSHQSQSSSYEADKKALDSQWRADTRRANKIKNTDDRNIKISDINTQYYRDLSALNKSKSKHQATKPAQSYQVGSLGHTITSALLAFVCSFGLMFVSGFLTVYHYPITPKALMSLRTKKDHDYSSDASNIQMMNHQFSPLVKGVVFSWFAKRFMGDTTPPPATEKQAIMVDQKQPTQNRPQPTKSTVGAVSTPNVETGVRTPDDEPKQGAKFRAINAGDIEEAKRAVMAGDLSPTIKPVKDWLLKVRRVGISDTARQDNARKLLNGMFKEGILILNPEQQFTKQTLAKYVLASNVKSEQGSTRTTGSITDRLDKGEHVGGDSNSSRKPQHMIDEQLPEVAAFGAAGFGVEPQYFAGAVVTNSDDEDQVGEFDITTRCGTCGGYSYTRIDILLDEQKGIVTCASCDKKYVAQSHLTSDSNPLDADLKERAIQSTKAGKVGAV